MRVRNKALIACVAAALALTAPTAAFAEEDWTYRLVVDSLTGINIRAAASEDSAIVGTLDTCAVADILEIGSEWTLIVSNGVQGYVKNEYTATGEAARALAAVYGQAGVKTYWDGVDIYAEPDGDSSVIATVNSGREFVIYQEYNYWYGIYLSDGSIGYIPKECVLAATVLPKATAVEGGVSYSADAVYGAESGSYAEAYEAESYTYETEGYAYTETESYSYETEGYSYTETEAPVYSTESTASETESAATESASSASAGSSDLNLLAALIYCEAGSTSYDGMVAVGAVVMNRVASGSFPSTIYDVIYQSGQFTPASSGALASALANGVPSSCYTAAQAALNGEDPTGGCLYFNAGRGTGTVIGGNQFY